MRAIAKGEKMGKFLFRTPLKFKYERDYQSVLTCIVRLREHCRDFIIREKFEGHPADVFERLKSPQSAGDKYMDNDGLILFDAADNLCSLNKSITGRYGYSAVCDVVSTHSGVGVNDWHWTLRNYKLKPEYADLLIAELDELYDAINANYCELKEQNFKLEMEKEERRKQIQNSIKSVEVSHKEIEDEGGKTSMYYYSFTFPDGETLKFSERNVFDFGHVINPVYSVAEGREPGGLYDIRNGIYVWLDFIPKEGWETVRALTKNEINAVAWIKEFGNLSNKPVRM